MNQSRQFRDTKPHCGLEATRVHSSPRATTLALHDEQGWRGVGGESSHLLIIGVSQEVEKPDNYAL